MVKASIYFWRVNLKERLPEAEKSQVLRFFLKGSINTFAPQIHPQAGP
jgi:hypothetical protein